MTGRRNGRGLECVVVDLNTQHDFCDPNGVCAVANVHELIPALRRVVAWAKRNYAPVISSLESHRPFEFYDSSRFVGCLDGTAGQRKIEFTIFHPYTQIEADNTLSCPLDLFKKYQQVIFCKRSDDLLGNPKADRFFTQLRAREFILFGIGIENSVKALTLGLLARRKHVSVVIDACGYWNQAVADLARRQMTAKGARIITVCDLFRRKLDRRRRPWLTYRVRPGSNNGPRRDGRPHKSNSGLSP